MVATQTKKLKVITRNCPQCGVEVECSGSVGLGRARRNRAFCSEQCKREKVSKEASERMAATNRRYASERMKRKNPMHNGVSKDKMKATLKEIGWKPPVRGGNGTGPTVPQKRLADALGIESEYAIRTGATRNDPRRLPTAYKVDLAYPSKKLAIEIDGQSHGVLSRQAQDRKKEAFLRSIGWTVLRFSNKQVMEHLEECVRTVTSTISKLKETTTTTPTES